MLRKSWIAAVVCLAAAGGAATPETAPNGSTANATAPNATAPQRF